MRIAPDREPKGPKRFACDVRDPSQRVTAFAVSPVPGPTRG